MVNSEVIGVDGAGNNDSSSDNIGKSGLDQLREELRSMREQWSASESTVLGAIATCVPAVIVQLDTGRIVASTTMADLLFGYIEGELVGMNVSELIPHRFHEAHALAFSKYADNPIARPIGSFPAPFQGLRRGGTEFPAEIGLFPRVVGGKRCVIAIMLPLPNRDAESIH